MSGEFAGKLKERIRIERPAALRDAVGLQQPGWDPVASCRAAIVPDGTGADVEAMAMSANQRFQVTIRRRDGVAVGQRLKWRERALLVRQRIDDPRAPDRILLRCEEMR